MTCAKVCWDGGRGAVCIFLGMQSYKASSSLFFSLHLFCISVRAEPKELASFSLSKRLAKLRHHPLSWMLIVAKALPVAWITHLWRCREQEIHNSTNLFPLCLTCYGRCFVLQLCLVCGQHRDRIQSPDWESDCFISVFCQARLVSVRFRWHHWICSSRALWVQLRGYKWLHRRRS